MDTFLTLILIITSITLIVVILLQSGKGSGLAAGFGGASAGTQVFGGSGAGGFLLKVTIVLGTIFMATSIGLAYLSSQPKSALSDVESAAAPGSAGFQEDEIVTHGTGAPVAPDDSAEPSEAEEPAPLNIEPTVAPEDAAPVVEPGENTDSIAVPVDKFEPKVAPVQEANPAEEPVEAPAEEPVEAPAEEPVEDSAPTPAPE
jgi:preprotein translocase subunit SecG